MQNNQFKTNIDPNFPNNNQNLTILTETTNFPFKTRIFPTKTANLNK